MAYYQKVKGPGSSTANTDINLNLYALNSSAFPTSGGTYACSTSNSAPYDFTNGATNYYVGGSRIYSNYGGSYTLTTTVTGAGNLASWSLSRGTSPERNASTGSLTNITSPSNNTYTDTVYRADTLTAAATAKSNTSSTNFTTLSAPTVTATTNTSITLKNTTGYTCKLYRGTTQLTASLANNSTYSDSGLTAGQSYSYTLRATNTITYTNYSKSIDWTSKTVTGTPTLNISGTVSTSTASGSEITGTAKSQAVPYGLKLTKNSNITSLSYKINGASSYTTVTSTTTVYATPGTTMYMYATPASGYTTTYTSSNPYSKAASNYEFSPTATSSSTTVTVYLRGTYASQYQGKIYVRTGGYSGTNVSGWPKTVSSGTANNSSIGTFTATTGTTYYLSGDTYSTVRYDYTVGSTTTISNNQMLATVTRTSASISCGCVRQGVQLEELNPL